MPSIKANGIDLYYEAYGEGAPILGIHGTPSSALLWVDAAAELASHGRCIIYDRRGFPRSERPEPFEAVDLVDHVDDAAALLLSEEPLDLSAEELAGIGQPTLIVSSEDSPEVLRRVNDRLAAALPQTEKVLVTGGHLINPAHPAILEYVGRILTPSG